jgi:ribosomal protein S18 acetylase RimI-like enzyme
MTPATQAVARGIEVRTAALHDERALIATLVTAFAADPAVRWMYPEPERYLMYFPLFVSAFGGRAFPHRSAYFTDGYRGASLWLPPAVGPDEEVLGALLENSVPEHRKREAFAILDRMGQFHPTEPHWYLPLIGVDPTCQRQGYGTALLTEALRVCDGEALPAYLECSNPRNLSLYERFGFERAGVIQVGSAPPVVPMWRAARAHRAERG